MKVQLYEWLYSHEGSNIIVNKEFKELEFVAKSVELNTPSQSTQYITSEYIQQILFYGSTSPHIRWWHWKNSFNYDGDFSKETKISLDLNGMSINDKFVSDWSFIDIKYNKLGEYIQIFDMQKTRVGNVSGISYVKTDTLHLKPCKLLSPYQSHPAGECAMIDVLSNTLYFNQGIGSFSVEGEALEIIDTTPCYNNIISKESVKAVRLREAIRATNRAHIEILFIPNDFSIRAKYDTEKITHGYTARIWALAYANATDNLGLSADYDLNASVNANRIAQYLSDGEGASETNLPSNASANDVTIRQNGTYTINGIDGSYTSRVDFNVSYRLTIFNVFAGSDRGFKGLVNFIEVRNGSQILDLHPAELALPYDTHPIGEACMIDLQSGDLYFNQGSGSFSCEGAFLGYWQDKPMTEHYCDVEGTLHRSVQIFADNGERLRLIWEKNLPFTTHRWLKGDGVAFINTLAHFNECETDLKTSFIIHEMPKSSGVYKTLFGARNSSNINASTPAIINYNFGVSFRWTRNYDEYTPKIKEETIYKVCIDNSKRIWTLNDYEEKISKYNTGAIIHNDFYIFTEGNVSNAPQIERVIKADFGNFEFGDFHLSPAILSRPTLAKEDNNNIARKQGEAVFVDEERYRRGLPWVFGNVATSGSFSVSDYLI